MHIMLIEDHPLFRDGVSMILQQLGDDTQIECGESAGDAIELANRDARFDLILLDFHLSGSTGMEALHALQELQPETPVIMLSAEQDGRLMQQAMAAGARGFITKSSSSQIILSAIQLVMSGGQYVPPEMLTALSQPSEAPAVEAPSAAKSTSRYHLTDRQKDVLKFMLDGQSNKEIARELNMSPSTVKVHVAAILRELNVKNRTQAVNIARAEHLLDSAD